MDFLENKVAKFLWIVFPFCLILFGSIGNALSYVVLNQRHRPRTSTSTYLSALAVCDLLVLYVGLLRHLIRVTLNFDIRHMNDIACKVHFYLVNVLLQLSSWILVAITIERVKNVHKPHLAKVGCTRKVAVAVLFVELLCLMTLNGHVLYGVKIRFYEIYNATGSNISYYSCEPNHVDDDYSNFMYFTWTWIDFAVVYFLPFLTLVTCNIIIIANVKRSKRFQSQVITRTRITPITTQKPLIPMTAMLLTLNSVFFVCVGPVNVFSIGQFHWWPAVTDAHTLAIQHLIWAVLNIFMYTNNAVNFLLYIMCGSEFRLEVKRLLLKPYYDHNEHKALLDRGRISTRFHHVELSSV